MKANQVDNTEQRLCSIREEIIYIISKLTMALEEELMTAEAAAWATEETSEENKNPDELTDEQVEQVKEMMAMPWWTVVCDCMDKRIKKQEDDILVLAKEHFMEPKKMGYSAFEVLWGFVQGMWEMQRLVKVITADPEEIRKAVEALQQAEAELTGQWKKHNNKKKRK